jgi:TRAP transporter 4TM/12TM fusion protein
MFSLKFWGALCDIMDRNRYLKILPDSFIPERTEKSSQLFHVLVTFGGVALAIFQLLQAVVVTNSSIDLYVIHVVATLLLILLVSVGKLFIGAKRSPFHLVLRIFSAVLAFVCCLYIWTNSLHLEVNWPFISTTDIIVGFGLFFAVSVATWVSWGSMLTIVGIAGILYFILGNYLPGLLGHSAVSLAYAVSYLGMSIKTGMFWLIPLSITVIFPLMVFGCVIKATGATEVFAEFMKASGRISKIAPVYTCVLQSSIIGMVTGAPNVNVVLVGSITIPAMKKIGIRPERAAGLEALASTGSQLVPPIMGLAAFVMAELIGVPYVVVMIAAILPSVLYYGALMISAYFVSMNDLEGVQYRASDAIEWSKVYRLLPTFVVPLGVIIYLLFVGFSPLYGSFLAIIAALVLSQAQGKFRPSFAEIVKGFCEGSILGSEIAVVLMSVGFMGQALMSTGLALQLSRLFGALIGGSFAVSLIVLMVVSLVIGMGAPTVVAYVLCAIAVVPAVQDLGISLMSAHFFAFYFSTFSHITPPVAGAVFTACQLAKTNYVKTAWEAVKLSWPLFLVPFIFLNHPEFLHPSRMVLGDIIVLFAYFLAVINGVCVVYNGEPRLRIGFICRIVLCLATVSGVLYLLKDASIYFETLLALSLVGWGVPLLRRVASGKEAAYNLSRVNSK